MQHKEKIEELYQQFRKPLLRFIRYKVTDEYLAEDLLQEVFLKASQSLESLKDEKKIQSWLFSIASNRIVDYYRKKKVYLSDTVDLVEEVEETATLNELASCVKPFLNSLPLSQQKAMKAIYLDELTQVEYAKKQELNLSTVKSQVKRGKAGMKEFFETCCSFERNQHNEIVDFDGKDCKICD